MPCAASAAKLISDSEFEKDLNVRVARARQTMDYASSQRCHFSQLAIASLSIWEALDMLTELPRCVHSSMEAICRSCSLVIFPRFCSRFGGYLGLSPSVFQAHSVLL